MTRPRLYRHAHGCHGRRTERTPVPDGGVALHEAQTAERTKRLRIEERRRNERERRRKARAAQLAAQQAQQAYVYYENCTAVENAGAAPIYAGQPGYSRDLDRDGDGVACEQ